MDKPFNKLSQKHRDIILYGSDGEEIEFSGGFTDLHTLVYQKTLAGEGFGIDEAKTAIQIVHDIRNIEPSGINHNSHPIFQQHRS